MTATVLVVDDDPVQRRLLEAMVRRFGYEALVASSGEEALTILRSESGGGVDVLVKAVARLVANGLDLHLLLIGDALGTTDPTNAAALADLRRAVDVLGLQARVHWTGHCQPAEVAGWLRCLDVAVLPFADGASPRRTSILAAWANGVPVLTTTPASAAPKVATSAQSARLRPRTAGGTAALLPKDERTTPRSLSSAPDQPD